VIFKYKLILPTLINIEPIKTVPLKRPLSIFSKKTVFNFKNT
jgi:hypothetical protein